MNDHEKVLAIARSNVVTDRGAGAVPVGVGSPIYLSIYLSVYLSDQLSIH